MKMENGELKMSDEKHETIMDIEADLRKRAEALEKALGDQHSYEPHHRASRTYTGLRNRLLEGTNRTLCAPGPRRKERGPHKRLTQTCRGVSRSL